MVSLFVESVIAPIYPVLKFKVYVRDANSDPVHAFWKLTLNCNPLYEKGLFKETVDMLVLLAAAPPSKIYMDCPVWVADYGILH